MTITEAREQKKKMLGIYTEIHNKCGIAGCKDPEQIAFADWAISEWDRLEKLYPEKRPKPISNVRAETDLSKMKWYTTY